MIAIYGHNRCAWCKRAKQLAERYELKYEWRDTDDATHMSQLKTMLPDVRTVPQIWWHDRHIGGYEDFAKEVENTAGNYGQELF